MSGDSGNDRFDSLEQALSELSEAERAGVFSRSPVEARSLLDHPDSPPILRMSRAAKGWLSAAAAFFLVASTGSLLFYREFGEMRERLADSASRRGRVQIEAVIACVSGPTSLLPGQCDPYDFDSDGDVDLVDVRSYQLGYESQR